IRLAISDPLDVDTLDSLSHVLKLSVEPSVAPADEIKHTIDRFYGKDAEELDAMLNEFSVGGAEASGVSTVAVDGMPSAEEGDAPIIKLVHQIIRGAIQRRASDIHLEPLEKRFRVRYRIVGVLLEVENPPKRLQLSMISRLKIMANISI